MQPTIMLELSEKIDKMDSRQLLELFLMIGNELLDRAEAMKDPGPQPAAGPVPGRRTIRGAPG